MRIVRAAPLCLFVITGLACGPTPPPAGNGGDGGVPTDEVCASKSLTHVLPQDWHHTATCMDACGNGLNPPTGGPHCPQWLACRVYDEAQPLCNWVHNLEHGHVVLLYNCPGGCPEIVDGLKKIWEEAGANGAPRRILITPWSGLQKKVAAVVAGWSWSGDAFDEDAIRCVLSHQDVEAPEAGLECSQ
ncbi:MAG: DUF3105 domain-containing protein [Myxococcaceae bacterium]|nr:DUF3105 domain-containing protein [Myxococcaceae bacterium]